MEKPTYTELLLINEFFSGTSFETQYNALAMLRKHLSVLKENLGIEPELARLCSEGNRVSAIKLYRDHAKCSLVEAKNYIDSRYV